MTKDNDTRINAIQSEIIKCVKAIDAQKQEKKSNAASFNSTIKALEAELSRLIESLEEIHRQDLTKQADALLEEDDEEPLTLGR